jgi:hypothetical protein
MRVIDLGPGGANDINDAGQVVGESLVATGGKLRLAGLSSPASRRRIEPRWAPTSLRTDDHCYSDNALQIDPKRKFPDLPCPASLSIGEDSKEGADAGIVGERGDLNPPDSWRNHALKTTFRPMSNGG